MLNNYAVSSEMNSIERLDELSLYLEICKYKKKLERCEYIRIITPNHDKSSIQTELSNLKWKIKIHEKQLEKFGIDIQDKEQIHIWKAACQNYLNQLSMLEYTILLQTRMAGQSLEMFCPKVDGQSFFLKMNHENPIQEKVMAMKIS